MQFDPNSGLEDQLKGLSGGNVLEDVVASTLSHLGYTVFQSLKVDIEGENICEIDVFASLHTPLKENRIIFECKGGEPSFRDIRNLHSIYSIIDPKPDQCFVVCKDGTKKNRIELGNRLGVQIVMKAELIKWLLPLLSGTYSREETTKQINRWLIYYNVQRYLTGKATDNLQSKQQLRFLKHDLWWKPDPLEQAKESFDKAKKDYLNVTSILAKSKNIKLNDCLKNASDDHIEGAMFAELLHRIMNMYSVTRCSLHFHTKLSRADLLKEFGPSLRDSIVRIGESPRLLFGFPAFFQYWIAQWGGVILNKQREVEIQTMASESKTTTEAVEAYIKVIEDTYSSENSDGCIYKGKDRMFFKYVPGAIRALGIINRREKNLLKNGDSVFSLSEDSAYIEALERAITSIGGIRVLQW